MTLALSILFFAAVAFVVSQSAKRRQGTQDPHIQHNISIKLTDQESEVYRKKQAEVFDLMRKLLQKNISIKQDRLDELIDRIQKVHTWNSRYNVSLPFRDEPRLTLDEKRSLKLNTRRQYPRSLIDYFVRESLGDVEPISVLSTSLHDAMHRVSRKYSLEQLRSASIKKVIVDCNHGDACGAVLKVQKKYHIDKVPQLPLLGCTSEFCMCSYMADL